MAINLGVFSVPSNSQSIKINNQKTHKFTIISSNVVDLVTVRVEFSEDNSTWFNITDYDYEIKENDVNNLIVTENVPINFLRFKYVSGDGDLQVYYTNY